MKKNLLSLCLSLALSLGAPLAANADTPANVSVAPAISAATLQSLPWQPLQPPVSQEIKLDNVSPQINQGDIQGAIAAYTLPADRGSLEVTLSSISKNRSLYAPSVLVLDEHQRPAAYYPSSYFPYQPPGAMSSDRLEGTLKLTPALGQKQIYLLVYTTRQDLAKTTQLTNPAKAYAAGVGNAVPDIPDPVASHSTSGTLKLKVTAEQGSGNVMIGMLQPAPTTAPVVVGSTAPVATAAPAPAPAKPAEPMLNDTESYFNNGIKQAVKAGDIDKALKLMNEAEKLGSTTARKTFISSVKGKG
ncbi:maltose regulon periplasmic protein [Serratia entomophila]|jgi:maltose operon protein|uniref:maltose operon protein MalM n=1 Tax=Serratia entomophila TaxID=42906 RepID=UPI001F3EB4FF|nr:maltose operon protein MalM [Serratia entomophila]UIW17986.1 maltose operon protein MalM [Serratia entomophila]CAI0786768.1 maltose regulon periplasmic protein [Serratia entomophila]CAI0937366.1 maltose regulon periplasmic protein [Serratia entomophila]CAI0948477.1 maltose regulon periplasmic protein [Serratia entomophila]CAI0964878.1 maltose regulon periplasmic protein [Serratia entomophila]